MVPTLAPSPPGIADRIGQRTRLRLRGGTGSLTGMLKPGDGVLAVIDVGTPDDPVTLRLDPDDVVGVEDATGVRAPDGTHRLHRWLTPVPDEVWADAVAHHEAAHAVVARVCGLHVRSVNIVADRTAEEGGGIVIAGGDAQGIAVALTAGGLAHTRRLTQAGHGGPMVAAAIEQLASQGDRTTIAGLANDGFVVYELQAAIDADRLLDDARVWDAIGRLAAYLLERLRADTDAINAVIGDAAELTCHRVWMP